MKLLLTFSIFLCTFLLKEQRLVNASTIKHSFVGTKAEDIRRDSTASINSELDNLIAELSLCDDDNDEDDDLESIRKKIQLVRDRSPYSIEQILLYHPSFDSQFSPAPASSHSAVERYILQQVFRL